MPELPASVRLCLWGTRYLLDPSAGQEGARYALARATSDADDVCGGSARLALWRDLGERALLVALPAPGDIAGLPRGGADFVAAALEAGECVHAPGLGGALVPRVETYGPDGDEGLAVTWEPFDCEPPEPHVLAGFDVREARRALRSTLATAATRLESLDLAPWDTRPGRRVDARLAGGTWGLPEDVDPDAGEVLRQAARLWTIAESTLEEFQDARSSASQERTQVLRRVQREARHALQVATCAAGLAGAGSGPQRRTSW